MVTASTCALICLLSGADNTVLLEFTADWCGACRSAEPTVKRLIADGYSVHPVNIDREPDTAARFHVTSVPCFVLLEAGQEVDRVVGAASYARLAQMFERPDARPATQGQLASNRGQPSIRGQSPGGAGFGLPRPLSSLAKGFGARNGSGRQADSGVEAVSVIDSASANSPRPGQSSIQNTATFQQPESAGPVRSGSSLPGSYSNLNSASPGVASRFVQDALRASVRLRVEDGAGNSLGSGTIIDAHEHEALLVTCGHIFRESAGKGPIAVDLFVDGQPKTVAGSLISYDLDRDVALVAIVPGMTLAPARVAPPGFRIAMGQAVFSIGCDKGADPTIRQSSITAIDRYVGAPNLEVAGMPVDGRSGGGLFSAEGYLIGVCNAADPQDQEGIFASLPIVHWELDKIGQRGIYDPAGPTLAVSASQQQPQSTAIREVAAQQPQPTAASDVAFLGTLPREMPRGNVVINAPATVRESAEDLEVICIMRSRNNPQGSERLLVLDRPSRELLDRLTSESQRRPLAEVAQSSSITATSPATTPDRFNRHTPDLRNGQTIRAQSNDR